MSGTYLCTSCSTFFAVSSHDLSHDQISYIILSSPWCDIMPLILLLVLVGLVLRTEKRRARAGTYPLKLHFPRFLRLLTASSLDIASASTGIRSIVYVPACGIQRLGFSPSTSATSRIHESRASACTHSELPANNRCCISPVQP